MSSPRIRPRFSLVVDLETEEAQRRIFGQVEADHVQCEVKTFKGYMSLRIPEADRHFWSPRLTLAFDQIEDGKTELVGVYGPNANVWSLFLYGYLIVGSLWVFSGILGFVQLSMGNSAWGLWIFGVMSVAMVVLYLLAQMGQKLGAEQTTLLHGIVESAMERMAVIE